MDTGPVKQRKPVHRKKEECTTRSTAKKYQVLVLYQHYFYTDELI